MIWDDSSLLSKIMAPIVGMLSFLPDGILSFTGKVVIAIFLAITSWATHKVLDRWWQKIKKQ